MYQVKAVVILADCLERVPDNVGNSVRLVFLEGLQPVPKLVDVKGCARFPSGRAGLGYGTGAVESLLVDKLATLRVGKACLFPCQLWVVIVLAVQLSNFP
jgi:hypothetical protein